jgi:uncharacterized GH25 family protein
MLAARAAVLALGLALAAAPAAQAHRAWLKPQTTILSGEQGFVAVDAGISDVPFLADHQPMRLDGLTIVGPDGVERAPQNPATGKLRSTFDAALPKPGTYRVAAVTQGAMASYKLGEETKRWRGSAAELASAIPAGATEVKVTESVRRIETFMTLGAPNATALKPSGKGLEFEFITHPSDLAAGAPAQFRLLLDGKPAAGVDVDFVLGETRYRATGVERTVKSAADGRVKITWPEAGMYWVEAIVRDDQASIPGAQRSASYVATLEVQPN